MDTCKNCVHYEACNFVLNYMDDGYGASWEELYRNCQRFKPKDCYIELPPKLFEVTDILGEPYIEEYDVTSWTFDANHKLVRANINTQYEKGTNMDVSDFCYTKQEAEQKLKEL